MVNQAVPANIRLQRELDMEPARGKVYRPHGAHIRDDTFLIFFKISYFFFSLLPREDPGWGLLMELPGDE